MQTTLLGLAIAVILALVSALLAPLVIDWSRYRSSFEQEASRLTGLTVHVNGHIDAHILPTPHLKLRNVEIGAAGRPPFMQADFIELEIGLGPLLRGRAQVSELRLVAPQINVGLDKSGAIDWPISSSSLRPEALTVSRFSIEDGRVALTDATPGGRIVLQKLSFNGDIRSFAGPFHGDGSFVVGDEPYSYRISGGHVDEVGKVRLKLDVDPTEHPLTTEVDGTLGFAGRVPQFDGTLSLVRPVGAALAGGERVMSDPWQLVGKIHATPAAASLRDLTLQYGPDERAVNFAGKADVMFGAHPHLDGTISAVQVDVDRMLAAPDVTHRPPFVMLKSFLEAFVAAVKPPMPVAVAVDFDALTVSGTTLQSLHGNVAYADKRWSLDRITFRAPGFTEMNMSGSLDNGAQGLTFSGPASLQSADVKTLMAWLEGRTDQPQGPTETLTARGAMTVGGDRFAIEGLSATLDQESVEGRLAYTWAINNRPATLDGELHATKFNFDALMAFAKAAAADDAFQVPREVALVLNIGQATAAGVDARKVDARLKFDAGVIHIDRLSVGDLGGAALDISGRIDELSSQPRGKLTLNLDAGTLNGLADVVAKFAPPAGNALRLFADRLTPAKVHGVLTIDRAASAGTVAKLDFGGDLGALRVAVNGDLTGAPAKPTAAVVHLTGRFDTDDGDALVRLLALDHVLAVDQLPGQMTISMTGPLNGDLKINGLASAGGFAAAATGTLHLTGEQAPTGSLQLKASAADLRPLERTLTGQPGIAVPVTATAIVGLAGTDLSVTDLVVGIEKSSLRGRLDLKIARPVAVSGEIAGNAMDAAAVSAALFGLPRAAPNSGAPWASAPVGLGAFAALSGDVNFSFERAALTPVLVAHDLKGVAHFQPPQIALRDIDGSLAGGRLTGALTLRRDSDKFAAQGRIELAGANAATIAGASKNSIDGLLTVKLQGDVIGASPDALVRSLHGGGTLALANGQFGGFNPGVFRVAANVADQSGSVEAAKIAPAVGAAMDKGRLVVPDSKADVTITGGQIRLANVMLHAHDGADLALDGVADLNRLTIDARMTMSEPPALNALIGTRPEIAVTLKGPLAAPDRRLDLSPLVSWLALRAAEQQTRRLELIEANQRADLLGPVIRPPAPSMRFILQGAPVEMNASIPAPSPPGPRVIERLRPETPPGIKLPVARPPAAGDNATAAAGTTRPVAPPAVRSPLDLLFHSQN